MTELNPPHPKASPHAFSWFTNLLGYFQRTERPASVDPDFFADYGPEDTKIPSTLSDTLRLSADRQRRLSIYEEMDSFGLVESVLDLYAEESTQPDYDRQRRVWIESNNQRMVSVGDTCLNNLRAEDVIAQVTRNIAKYGDEFRRLVYETKAGVLGWVSVDAAKVERHNDAFARLVGFSERGRKYRGSKDRAVSWPWDYVHFRLMGKRSGDLYGTSLLEAMFRPWRQLALTEDAMLMYRLRRMPDRNAFFVNVGNLDPVQSARAVADTRKRFRKHEYIDPASSQYAKQFNPLTPMEDVFVPVRAGDDLRVETIAGGGNIGEIYDLEYFRDAFFGAARVPKAFLGFEGDINAKATLIQQDVRFARTCKRLRHSTIQGIRTTLDIHYTLSSGETNFDPSLPENAYVVMMSPITYLDEFERLELIELRYRIVESMSRLASDMQMDARVWATYILLNFAKLPEDLVLKLISKTPDAVTAESARDAFFARMSPTRRARFDSLDESLRAQILDFDADQQRGIYDLNPNEVLEVATTIAQSPSIRKSIGDFAIYFNEEDYVMEAAQQVDRSVMPPQRIDGELSTIDESDLKTQLTEDLRDLNSSSGSDESSDDPDSESAS